MVTWCRQGGNMSNKTDRYKTSEEVTHYAKVYTYPCGVVDILCSTKPIFREVGWEDAHWAKPRKLPPEPEAKAEAEGEPEEQLSFSLESEAPMTEPEAEEAGPKDEDIKRSMRRAKSRVRRLALANDFRWFVTLTLSPEKVDRYDDAQVVRKLTTWAHNQVRRRGLKYILVPERHKDGAIHFHGFFNDVLPVVDSGTIKIPGVKKPRRPRSKAQREEWLSSGGHIVYNMPSWSLGFTSALEVYGDYPCAVGYVCKYIGKQGDKPAGRWYYSGGDLREPSAVYGEISPRDLVEQFGNRAFVFDVPGATMAVCNGLKKEEFG